MMLILAIFALPKGRGAHRSLGRWAAAALLLSALSSFAIQSRGHLSALHILSAITLVNIPYAVWMARTGRIPAHRRAMLINAGGLFTAGLAATFAPGRYLHTLLFG
ncbi:hypothetical protein EJV46_09770 [Roseococcus sp. SYP-B2431]|uniref:hypothetical protein n=1 Tax=Roseococcus sp. SYP-B2431 TaxID=2496640 RepID=UPI00103E61DA|nr:hypothetical protein [Roseococcus sp. SYP-B2431]TCH98842.1 hypothetical protein EJV46_09770 [Roseococcus sp. SYP-B2431]